MWRRCLWSLPAISNSYQLRDPFRRPLLSSNIGECARNTAHYLGQKSVSNNPNLRALPISGCRSPPGIDRIDRAMHDVSHSTAVAWLGLCHPQTVPGEGGEILLANQTRCPFGHGLQVQCGPPLPRVIALQRLPNAPPDAIAIFSPYCIVTSVKAFRLSLDADNRQVIGKVSIDRLDQSPLGHSRANIHCAGHLANRVDTRVCPSGQINARCLAMQTGKCVFQFFLNTSTICLPLAPHKTSSIVGNGEL